MEDTIVCTVHAKPVEIKPDPATETHQALSTEHEGELQTTTDTNVILRPYGPLPKPKKKRSGRRKRLLYERSNVKKLAAQEEDPEKRRILEDRARELIKAAYSKSTITNKI